MPFLCKFNYVQSSHGTRVYRTCWLSPTPVRRQDFTGSFSYTGFKKCCQQELQLLIYFVRSNRVSIIQRVYLLLTLTQIIQRLPLARRDLQARVAILINQFLHPHTVHALYARCCCETGPISRNSTWKKKRTNTKLKKHAKSSPECQNKTPVNPRSRKSMVQGPKTMCFLSVACRTQI